MLRCREFGKSWVLDREYVLDLTECEVPDMKYVFRIPAEYVFDLSSSPRWLWWLVAPYELSIVAPLLHDYLYECKGKIPPGRCTKDGKVVAELTRSETDDLFAVIMWLEGVPRWRRFLGYNAVHIFGGWFWGRGSTMPSFAPKAQTEDDPTKPSAS